MLSRALDPEIHLKSSFDRDPNVLSPATISLIPRALINLSSPQRGRDENEYTRWAIVYASVARLVTDANKVFHQMIDCIMRNTQRRLLTTWRVAAVTRYELWQCSEQFQQVYTRPNRGQTSISPSRNAFQLQDKHVADQQLRDPPCLSRENANDILTLALFLTQRYVKYARNIRDDLRSHVGRILAPYSVRVLHVDKTRVLMKRIKKEIDIPFRGIFKSTINLAQC